MRVFMILIFLMVTYKAYSSEIQPILTLDTGGHKALIGKIIATSDGKEIVSTADDKTIRVWDATTFKEKRKILGEISPEQGNVYTIALSPDDRWLAAGGLIGNQGYEENHIRIFDFKTGRLVAVLKGHQNVVYDLAFSPDGAFLVSASADRTSRIWDMSSLNQDNRLNNITSVAVLTEHTDYVTAVNCYLNGGVYRIVTAGMDNKINLYEFAGKKPRLISTYTHLEKIKYLSTSKNFIAAAPLKGNVILIFDHNLNKIKTIKSETKPTRLAFSPDGKLLLAGSGDFPDVCVVYDTIRNFAKTSSFSRHDNLTMATAFINNSTAITGGGINYDMYIWDVKSGKVKGHIVGDGLWASAVGLNGNELGFGNKASAPEDSWNHSAPITKSINLQTGIILKYKENYSFKRIPSKRGNLSLSHSSGGRFKEKDAVLTISVAGEVTAKITREAEDGFGHHTYGIINNGLVISGGAAGHISAYNQYGEEIAKFIGQGGEIISLANDGDFIVSGSTDQTIKIWNVRGIEKFKPIKRVKDDWVNYLAKTYDSTPKQIIAVSNNLRKEGVDIYSYDSATIHPLLSLFISKGNEWVMWTEEGYFNASPGGAKYVGYHINQGPEKEAYFVPLNNLYDVFYRPDIIQAKLKGEDISSLITLTADEALKTPPPEVKFTTIPRKSAEKSAKVCYQVKSTGGGIGEVRLFQNGKLIKSDGFYRETAKMETTDKIQIASMNSRAIYQDQRGLVVREKKAANAAISKPKNDLFDECVEIEPISGENEISLAAFNAPNTVQGFMETATFISTRKADEPHLYILSVGIDTYRDSSINLKYAAKDAKDFIAKLPEKAKSIYKPQNIHIVTLTNQQADKQSILKAIDDLATKVKHGDGFIFFNASHGVLLQNQYYIVTAGFDGNLDDNNSLIGSNEIVEMSKRIKSLSQLFIFDTCHAGGVDNIVSGLYDARVSVLAKKMGLHIYASAGSVQSAMDGYQGNGLYTHTLLQGIANGRQVDKDKTGNVTVKSLGLYTKEKTTEISTKLGQPQTPFIINFGRDNPLFVVR